MSISEDIKRREYNVGKNMNEGPEALASAFSAFSAFEAFLKVQEEFRNQLAVAARDASEPNQEASGDRAARQKFYTLLDINQQRKLFLQLCKTRSFLPRIRTLIGAPPFCFLKECDNYILNATGIAHGRVNMSVRGINVISSSAEIGVGHFIDARGRTYKVIKTEPEWNDVVVFARLERSRKAVLDMRLQRITTTMPPTTTTTTTPKTTAATADTATTTLAAPRSSIFKKRHHHHNSSPSTDSVPKVGEKMKLTLIPSLQESDISTPTTPTSPEFTVRAIVQRSAGSSVFRVFLSL